VLSFFHVATAPLSENVRRTILPEGQAAWDTRTVLTCFRNADAGSLIIGSVGALRGTGTAIHRNWALSSRARPQRARGMSCRL